MYTTLEYGNRSSRAFDLRTCNFYFGRRKVMHVILIEAVPTYELALHEYLVYIPENTWCVYPI